MARSIPVVPIEQQIAELEAALQALCSAKPFRGQIDLIRDVEAHLARVRGMQRRVKSTGRNHTMLAQPEAES